MLFLFATVVFLSKGVDDSATPFLLPNHASVHKTNVADSYTSGTFLWFQLLPDILHSTFLSTILSHTQGKDVSNSNPNPEAPSSGPCLARLVFCTAALAFLYTKFHPLSKYVPHIIPPTSFRFEPVATNTVAKL